MADTDGTKEVLKQDSDKLDRYAISRQNADDRSELMAPVPSLVQRGGIYLISAALVLTFGFLYLGKVNVVVSATGRIAPLGGIRSVPAPQGGLVQAVLAQAGDRLPAGAPLVQAGSETVTMPVAGTIVEMKSGNPGELVSAGGIVATIIPEGVPLIVTAEVPNKDIGFVRPGLEARIKVDAYPFEQFGVVTGRVTRVLPAVGGNFPVQLELLTDKLFVNGNAIALFPGLTVQAELLTAKQRLIDLLFSPANRGSNQASDVKGAP